MSETELRIGDEMLNPLEEAEYDELADILEARGDGEGLGLDAVHGLMTAVVISPMPIAASEWMPAIIDDGRAFSTLEQAERAISLLLRLFQSIVDDLETLSYEPVLGQEESESGELVLTAHGWCAGFSLGVDLRAELWQTRMRDDARLMNLLDPVVQLATDEGVFDAADGEDVVPLSENEYDDALSHIASAIIDVQQYWRENPPDGLSSDDDAAAANDLTSPRARSGRVLH
jgi:uncharacterized protein